MNLPRQVVPADDMAQREVAAFVRWVSSMTLEERRQAWIDLGEDPAVFDG